MQGRGPADPCPHFLQGHTNKPSGVDRRARPGRQCQGQKVREAGELGGAAGPRVVGACLGLSDEEADGREDRARRPTARLLGHQRLLASLHLLPQALCTAALRTEVLDPLQRRVD